MVARKKTKGNGTPLNSYDAFKDSGYNGYFHVKKDVLRPFIHKEGFPMKLNLYVIYHEEEHFLSIFNKETKGSWLKNFVVSSDYDGFYSFSPWDISTGGDANGFPVEVIIYEPSQPRLDRKRAQAKALEVETPEEEESKEEETEDELMNPDIYLGGAYWDGEDMLPEFLKGSYWEHGFDEPIKLIDEARSGDVLVVKSVVRNWGSLRLKAVGVIKRNHFNGKRLDIAWTSGIEKFENDGHVDVESLAGPYSKTFHRVKDEHRGKILHAIYGDDRPSNSPEQAKAGSDFVPTVHKASMSQDEVGDAVDMLGFARDATAFADLIALKDTSPPFSIAVFGEWGSGKSFFMKLIADKLNEHGFVDDLDFDLPKDEHYHKGISTITFNAWSYVDTNLWASLVTQIFEGLDHYLDKNKKPNGEIEELKNRLSTSLEMTKREHGELEQRLEDEEKVKGELESELTKAQKALDDSETGFKGIDKQGFFKEALNDSLFTKLKSEFIAVYPEAAEGLNSSDEQNEKAELYAYQEMAKDARSIGAYFRKFVSIQGFSWWAALILIIPILIGFAFLLYKDELNGLLQTALLSAAPLFAFLHRMQGTLTEMKPAIKTSLAFHALLSSQIEEAQRKYEDEVARLEKEIAEHALQVARIEKEKEEKEAAIKDIKSRQNGNLAGQALQHFVGQKATGKDYDEYLGLISLIRKDFETLSELFAESNGNSNAGHQPLKQKDYLSKPLNRIVLFIDDLDRCPVERVVEVLDAVKLLMCYDLFVVVVGVAPLWLHNSLVHRHYAQFGYFKNAKEHQSPYEKLVHINPHKYLEKIFQIPYHLRVPEPQDRDDYLKDLFKALTKSEDKRPKGSSYGGQSTNRPETGSLERPVPKTDKAPTLEYSKMGKEELKLALDAAVLVGDNPRALKRYSNLYRLIRVHENIQELYAEQGDKGRRKALFLLALFNGEFEGLAVCLSVSITKDSKDSLQSVFETEECKAHYKTELARIKTLIKEHKWLNEVFESTMGDAYPYYEVVRQYSFKHPKLNGVKPQGKNADDLLENGRHEQDGQ